MGVLLVFHQTYQPVLDSIFLSALVAGLPLYVLFVLLAVLRLPAWICALAAMLTAFVLSWVIWGMPFGVTVGAATVRIVRPFVNQMLGREPASFKVHAVLLDRQDAALPLRAPRHAALDLVGHGSVAHAEDLKAAGVGDDRGVPAHEAVQAAEA